MLFLDETLSIRTLILMVILIALFFSLYAYVMARFDEDETPEAKANRLLDFKPSALNLNPSVHKLMVDSLKLPESLVEMQVSGACAYNMALIEIEKYLVKTGQIERLEQTGERP